MNVDWTVNIVMNSTYTDKNVLGVYRGYFAKRALSAMRKHGG